MGPDRPIAFSRLYANGAVLGFTPQQVDACSFWQFSACVEGYNKANNPDEPQAPSNAEFDDMLARYEAIEASKMVH